MITIKHHGSFSKTETFFKRAANSEYIIRTLEKYGREGVAALASATPIDSGETARSWDYKIHRTAGGASISWVNSHIIDGISIAVILQYGHGTRNGGYVQGRDYINPALRPVFDKIANEVWREVVTL